MASLRETLEQSHTRGATKRDVFGVYRIDVIRQRGGRWLMRQYGPAGEEYAEGCSSLEEIEEWLYDPDIGDVGSH